VRMASGLSWANDPASFPYPHFFLAHEIAHQWWGQAVGWKNYREQWLSEGFAQYFAALYARQDRGEDAFTGILRQMRRTAMDASDQGPVHLGYRLGHIKGQSRVFRSLVYNKGAAVLHTLRRLIGDEAFFTGVRRYYQEHRFRKAGTDDLQAAMEAASGRSLERFFERWILTDGLPRITFSHRLLEGDFDAYAADGVLDTRPESPAVLLRFEQHGEVYDVPVTVTLTDASGGSRDVIVPLTDRLTERYVALDAPLRRVEVNRDHAALAHVTR
jgi:aminopeptidase N